MRIEEHPNFVCDASSEAAWHSHRRRVVTGSTLAAIMDMSPYSDFDKAIEEALNPSPRVDSAPMWWGRQMEGPNIDAWSEITGLPVAKSNSLLISGPIGATLDAYVPPGPWTQLPLEEQLIATTAPSYWSREYYQLEEALVPGGPVIVEAKNVSSFKVKDWAKIAPLYYWCQVQAQLFVTGWRHGVLFAKVGSADIRQFVIERDDFFLDGAVERASQYLMALEERRNGDSK
jgi:predicted phage-related endonuclease